MDEIKLVPSIHRIYGDAEMTPGKLIMFQQIAINSENKKWSLRKILDNWFMVIIVSVGLMTAKVAAEQLVMVIR